MPKSEKKDNNLLKTNRGKILLEFIWKQDTLKGFIPIIYKEDVLKLSSEQFDRYRYQCGFNDFVRQWIEQDLRPKNHRITKDLSLKIMDIATTKMHTRLYTHLTRYMFPEWNWIDLNDNNNINNQDKTDNHVDEKEKIISTENETKDNNIIITEENNVKPPAPISFFFQNYSFNGISETEALKILINTLHNFCDDLITQGYK
jgi:hypothetical protein